jgi:hypothetical protein
VKGCVRGLFKGTIEPLVGGTEKKPKRLNQNSRRSGQELNSGLPEYKAGGLSAQPSPIMSCVLPETSCVYLDWPCNEDNFVGFLQFYCVC